jgi:pyruvate/2-oxoglutarate dehydrogenase complex dihydrolipoamide acyltransferase (E2) component
MEFLLPDLGEGVQEGEITRWLVQAGETIREDQPLLEVMTDKVTAEIPSPVDGTVLDLLQPEGAVIPVGTPLIRIQERHEVETRGRNGGSAVEAAPGSRLPAPSKGDGSSRGERRTPASVRSREADGPLPPGAQPPARAVPMVRKLARDLGVNLETVTGTGPAGRITEADVRAAAGERPAQAPPSAAPPIVAPRPVEKHPAPAPPHAARIPFRGLRRRIAERMVKATQTAAPATFVDEVDLTELVALREKARDTAERQGVKLTFLPFVMKSACAALREHPRLNATIDEEREEILLSREYHLGVACETPEGLVVPVIRDVDRKGIFDLAREIAEKAERARTGQLEREELQGSSFSITSMGRLGGLMATPILNYPEVAILAVHRIVRRPVYRGEAIQPRDIAHLSLTFDHRALDGLDAARFVSTLIRYLEDPSLLLFS